MIKKILFLFTLLFTFCSINTYAARFGNGKSFGQHKSSSSSYSDNKSRYSNNQQQQKQPQQQQNAPPPAKPSFMSKMLPILAGLSIGALLGSLFSNGLGGGLAAGIGILLAAILVFALIKKLLSSRKNTSQNFNYFQNSNQQTNPEYAVSGNSSQEPYRYDNSDNHSNPVSTPYTSVAFDTEEFLRTAKTTFVRMQNAYDHKNLDDIRKFTTPEVFAEIQMQLQERGESANYTEVLRISASLLDDEPRYNDLNSATVLFSGQIKEQQSAPATNVNEVWHFVKNEHSNWVIAGIDQRN